MMYYIGVTLGALLVELAGVATMTGILFVYWNKLTNNKVDA